MENNNLMVFNHEEFGSFRGIEIDGEGWLVGKDVAEALGYQNGSRDINRHVDDEDRQNYQNGTFESPRGMTIINESGFYSLVLKSKMPKAKQFKRWVTSEVLPSIRKHGGYIAGQEEMSDEELMARALLMAQSQIEEKNRLLEEQRPLVEFANLVSDTTDLLSVGDFVKYLYDTKGINIGRNKLFEWFRRNKYIMQNNLPYQSYIKAGYFKAAETIKNNHICGVTMITGKGQLYFAKKLSADFIS